MISRPNDRTFESSDGWSVTAVGRSELRYREGGKVLLIESDRLDSGKEFLALYTGSMHRFEPPYDADVLTAADRDRIVHNIRTAYRSAGLEIRVSESC